MSTSGTTSVIVEAEHDGTLHGDSKGSLSDLNRRIIAACAGSLLTSVIVNPLDVVRVRMQQHSAYGDGPGPSFNGKDPVAANPAGKAQSPSGNASQTIRARDAGVGSSWNKPLLSAQNAFRAMPEASIPAFQTARYNSARSPFPTVLGETVCCRDVFWYPPGFDSCAASTSDPCAVKKPFVPEKMGTWRAMRTIAQDDGLSALWRGLPAQLVQAIPSSVVYFVAYEKLRDHSPLQHHPSLNYLLCGGLARMVGSTVVSPIELFKTRLQSTRGKGSFKAVSNSVMEMVRERGMSSLWSGLSLTLWRDVPFSSIYWLVIEKCRVALANNRHHFSDYLPEYDTMSWRLFENISAGITGGTIASLITNPFDVGKTRKQLCHYDSPSAHSSMLPYMKQVIQTEGWSALYVGIVPRTLKVAPACAIMITTYEMGKMMFN